MPKVIESGKNKGHKILGVFMCSGKGNGGHGCQAMLEVYIEDLFQTSDTDYSGDTQYFATFECPECGACTDVKYDSNSTLPTRNKLPVYNTKNQVLSKIQSLCGDDINKWQKMIDLLDNLN